MTAKKALAAVACIGLMLLPDGVTGHPGRDGAEDQEVIIAKCITLASGRKPWLERTLWGIRDQEAGWIGAEILNRNGSHDLGPMQINSEWVGRLALQLNRSPTLIRLWLVHDPCFNVDVARWIFLSGLSATNDFWRAIGLYHSPSPGRQRRYAQSVARKLTQRFGPSIFSHEALE